MDLRFWRFVTLSPAADIEKYLGNSHRKWNIRNILTHGDSICQVLHGDSWYKQSQYQFFNSKTSLCPIQPLKVHLIYQDS